MADRIENESRGILLEDLLMNNDPGHRWNVRWEREVNSTMDRGRSFLSVVSADSSVLCLADIQTAGRGTRGRSWISERGGLYSTTVLALRPNHRNLEDLPALSLVVGRIVAEVLREFGAEVGVKWPNDVLARDGRKVSGNLLELVREEGRDFLLIGVGINMDPFEESEKVEGVSLRELAGMSVDRGQLASVLVPRVRRASVAFMERGFADEAERWTSLALWLHHRVTVDVDGEVIEGLFQGVDKEGRLLLLCSDGQRALRSGRMRLREQGGRG